MAIYPSQQRAIDPYASYNSNIANRLTRMKTYDTNCLDHHHSMDVTIDSTSPITNVVVSDGIAYKDDVIIEFTSNWSVDMTDGDYYIPGTIPWNEAGYYYVAIDYTYAKSKPAPRAAIRILKPSQQAQITNDQYLFLKAVEVSFNGVTFEIENVYNSDPDDATVKRQYAQVWVGPEVTEPSFNQSRDEGRVIYVEDKDELYFGTSSRWENFGSIRVNADTTLCTAGQLAYMGPDGRMRPADNDNLAQGGILQVGTLTSGNGKVRLYGEVPNVPIEPGRTVSFGDEVRLSNIVDGAITDSTSADLQFVGICSKTGTHTTECDIWFMPYRVDYILDATNNLVITIHEIEAEIDAIQLELARIRSFIGKDAAGVEMPHYTSTHNINQNDPLETAVSDLDNAIANISTDAHIAKTNISRVILDGDTTPSILDGSNNYCGMLITLNSGATSITYFDDATACYEITIFFADNNTTLVNSANLRLSGGLDFTGNTYDTITLIYNDHECIWIEIARSLNS